MKEVFYVHQSYIYLIKSKNNNIVKYSLLQSSVSHDPLEIILIADLLFKKHFILLLLDFLLIYLKYFAKTELKYCHFLSI